MIVKIVAPIAAIDTIGFFGYNTAIQAVEVGTHFVAYEEQFMRGRLGAGVFKAIGMDDFIAKDREHFVKIVTNLVHYPSEQQDARSRISENRHKLFGDRSFIIAIKPELQNPSL